MRIRTLGLLAVTAATGGACGPAPGSAEWCKGVLNGKIDPSDQEIHANNDKCARELMYETMAPKPS